MRSSKNIDLYLNRKSQKSEIHRNKEYENFLNTVAFEFKQVKLYDGILDALSVLRNPVFESTKNNLLKLIHLEKNSVHIPLQEIRDLINFSIFVEMDNLLEDKKSVLGGISKFTDLSKMINESTINEKNSPDEFYSIKQVQESFLKISSIYTDNLEIKNDYLVVTFD